ncbi:MAG: helix-turn-helix domain-containing protein [Sphingomonas bacterium]|nr:helix-turn-helix domain-containing protein [Sphingomonas bacterium]
MSEVEDEIGLTAGQRLRAAREGLGLSLDDVATSTRIPMRHLESLETGDFSKLPAPTYSIGFAKSYAGAVGLDRREISEQLRGELGGTRLVARQAEQFEPMDPARSMPRWLIFVAIGAIIAAALAFSWLSSRSLNAPDNVVAEDVAAADLGQPAAPPPAATTAGPVVITANQQAWIQVKDGANLLKEGVLGPGQSFEVPANATAPMLVTGKAEALRILVGTATAPQVGPDATKVSKVSLLGPDLLRGPAAAATPAAPPTAATRPAPRPVARPAARPSAPAPAPAIATTDAAAPATPPTQ